MITKTLFGGRLVNLWAKYKLSAVSAQKQQKRLVTLSLFSLWVISLMQSEIIL